MKILKTIFLLLIMLTSNGILAQQDTVKLKRQARALLRQGNELYKKQKFTDASVAYRKALGKNSKYQKGSYNLGNAFYQDKNYKEAVPQYELTAKTAKDKTTKAEAYHNIGNAMMDQKQYQPAVDAYKKALRNNPNDDETRYNLAVAQQLLDKEKKKNKDKKDDKKKGDKDQKKDDKKKDKDKKDGEDKDKKKDDKDGEGDDKQDKNQQKKDDKKKQQPKPQQGKMSPQQIKQLLESLNNQEKKTQKKMNAKKSKGRKVNQEKDW